MARRYRIPKEESRRNYKVERDPNPNHRVFPCEFEEDESEWH